MMPGPPLPACPASRRSGRPARAGGPPGRHRPGRGGLRLLAIAAILLAAGCATHEAGKVPPRSPEEVRGQLVGLLPARLDDRAGWAADVQSAFQLLGVPPSTENLCAALAVTEQESGYDADPAVPGLGRIAREEIDRRAAALHVPRLVVSSALKLDSGDGRSYADRLASVRTERELSELYQQMIARVPLGRRLLADRNPVRTGGPMQVAIAFAERFAAERGYPYGDAGSIREEVFTRRGGLYFGIAHLLDYPNAYDRHLYRFADFNAGWYASRNAAFQAAVTEASGVRLALDGDLVVDGRIGATEAAARSLGPQLGLDADAIGRQLREADRHEFERTPLYRGVFALAERNTGRVLPRARVPDIDLKSPKITRKLTTAWFADRVQSRYQACVNRAFGRG